MEGLHAAWDWAVRTESNTIAAAVLAAAFALSGVLLKLGIDLLIACRATRRETLSLVQALTTEIEVRREAAALAWNNHNIERHIASMRADPAFFPFVTTDDDALSHYATHFGKLYGLPGGVLAPVIRYFEAARGIDAVLREMKGERFAKLSQDRRIKLPVALAYVSNQAYRLPWPSAARPDGTAPLAATGTQETIPDPAPDPAPVDLRRDVHEMGFDDRAARLADTALHALRRYRRLRALWPL